MRVAMVCPEYHPVPPIEGGAVETWIEEAAKRLKQHEVFVCSVFRPALKGFLKRDHVRYLYYKQGWMAKILLCTYKLPFKKENSSLYFLPYSFWCALRLRRYRPGIIHIHNRPQFVKIFKMFNPKAKIILHLHQVSAMEEKDLWNDSVINHVDLFLGVSDFIVKKIQENFPSVKKEQIGSVYNGIDPEAILPVWTQESERKDRLKKFSDKEEKIILYVGRLVENKGVHLLIEAVRNLVRKGHHELKLILCGAAGYSRNEVTSYVSRLCEMASEVKGVIVFTGYVAHEKIKDYYLLADCVVIPSLVEEGFGVVAIEAMAAGIPVVAFAKGGIREIINDRKDGVLLEDYTSRAIETAIQDLLIHPSVYLEYARNARIRVEQNFSWPIVVSKLETLYESVGAYA